jgi:phosphatidate cytidylyltransferase
VAASNLALRIISALVLAPIALAAVCFGGWPFAAFWSAAAIAVLWEWSTMVRQARPLPASEQVAWLAAGVCYAAVMLAAPIVLRKDVQFGLFAIVILFAIVWTTDIAGYFAGRAIGGPKLSAAISPKKTWSGAIAGTIGAMIIALLAVGFQGDFNLPMIAAIALLLSIASQIGDLLESAVKRRFGVKDASQLIPGHGGVMDRLDGFWAAVLVAALIGVARGGLDAPARGLLVW